jgi:TonB family protein
VVKLSVTPQDTSQKLQSDFEEFFAQEFRRRFRAPSRLPLSVVMGAPPCDSIGARCVGGYLDLSAVAYLTAHYDGKLSDIQVIDPTLTPDLANSVRSALQTMSREGLGPSLDADTVSLIIRLEADPRPDTVPEARHVFRAKVPHYTLPFRYASMPASGVELRYPFAARLAGIGDSVAVAFTVDAAGKIAPESLELVQASYRDFVAAVVTALEKTRYHPARLGDCPVSTRMSQRFLFDARGSQ